MTSVPNTIGEAQAFLRNALLQLSPTSHSGFEGFMASLLSELTGQTFHVVKSGHQEGSDVRSEHYNLLKIGLEGKRYKESTTLSRAELLHKVTEAATAVIPIDLWILATTRSIDASTRERTDQHGEQLGIGTIILDWPSNLTTICELAVICAAGENACDRYLGSSVSLTTALEIIRQHSEFQDTHSRILERLTQADTGYTNARRASERWFVQAQASLANAKSRLRGHHNLGESEYGVIPRADVHAQLDDWFVGDSSVSVLLGDEGTGKSWAVLDWHSKLKFTQNGAPLTLYLSAAAINSSNLKGTLAQTLYVQTQVRSESFWEKRLTLWESAGGCGVRILIIIDGLNENFQFTDWARWIQPLFEDHLHGMYKVILSCWRNWWTDSLAGLLNLTPKPQQILVEPFSEAELDFLLMSMSLKRSEFRKSVLKLMRVPRLSSLVVKHRVRLRLSGDVTAERVIYEDWKDRMERRGADVGLTDLEMKEFIASLGRKLESDIEKAVTRKDIIEDLSYQSGKSSFELRPAIAELTSGSWMQTGDVPYTFKVVPDRIPFVLGVALISRIRDESDVAATEARIADFLDPLKAHSLGCAILCAATTIALIESDTTRVHKRVLLYRWLEEQNCHFPDFEAFWRLAGLDPTLFLNLAEERWLTQTGRTFDDEVLIKGFASAANFDTFATALEERVTAWLGTAWPDPKVGAILGRVDLTSPGSIERANKTRSKYADWTASDGSKMFAEIHLDSRTGWSWLSARALAILSYLERAPFVRSFEAWAISRAIMGCPRHAEEVAWILRLNKEDESKGREAIQSLVRRLQSQTNAPCRLAAQYLVQAQSGVDRSPEPLAVEEVPENLAPMPLDIGSMDSNALCSAAADYLRPHGWRRHDGETGLSLVNALIERGLKGEVAALDLIAARIQDLVTIISPEVRELLLTQFEIRLKQFEELDERRNQKTARIQIAQLVVRVFDAKPQEQSALILSHGIDPHHDSWLVFFRSVSISDISNAEILDVPHKHLAYWLDYLYQRLAEKEIAKLRFLPELVVHGNVAIRQSALALAVRGTHLGALEAFSTSTYALPCGENEQPERIQEYWRNLALLTLHKFDPPSALWDILSQESIALMANNGPKNGDALEKFNSFLRSQFIAIKTSSSWSSPYYWRSYRQAVSALIEYDRELLLGWVEPWLLDSQNITDKALMDSFPVLDTMQALCVNAPDVARRIHDILVEQSRSGIISTDGISNFPFQLRASPAANALCQAQVDECTTDIELLELAVRAQKNDRLDWLFRCIQEFEQRRTSSDVATAYTLLGFCDVSARADKLWKDFLARPPSDGWLDNVIRASYGDYARNRSVRTAFSEFWCSDNSWIARNAMKLVTEQCDMRIGVWIHDIDPNWEECEYGRLIARSLATAEIKNAIKKDKDRRKKELFHTSLAFPTMHPWR